MKGTSVMDGLDMGNTNYGVSFDNSWFLHSVS